MSIILISLSFNNGQYSGEESKIKLFQPVIMVVHR